LDEGVRKSSARAIRRESNSEGTRKRLDQEFEVLPVDASQLGKTIDPLLEELRGSLQTKFHKDCLEAYLANPSASSIAVKALETVKSIINETD
jgi:hypothetical protein